MPDPAPTIMMGLKLKGRNELVHRGEERGEKRGEKRGEERRGEDKPVRG